MTPTMLSIEFSYTGKREKLLLRNISSISSRESVTSTAITSTRGVKISLTSRSLNSIAAQIKSLSCASRSPSFWASSTMVSSSSWVMESSFSTLNIIESSFFHKLNRKLIGVKSVWIKPITPATAIANFSGVSFAMLFGEISPKIKITIVMTAVDRLTPASPKPKFCTNKTVANDEARILTTLLPTRIVDNSRS